MSVQKKSEELWHLYGNTYDLTSFQDKHPGGKQILTICKGHQDITPMFESYHAFADFEKYKQDLETYKVGKSEYPVRYTFEKGDFYHTVRDRVRKYFGDAKNINDKVKINNFWFLKVSIIITLFFSNLYMAFVKQDISTLQGCFHALLAGMFLICVGMCVLHDSSHFALFRRNPQKNDVFTRIVGCFLMWKSELWLTHHSFRHHTYTGDENLDPDITNYYPFIKKVQRHNKKYLRFPQKFLSIATVILLWFFPGQAIGQSIVYWIQWPRKGHVWKMKYPKEIMNRKVWENVLFFLCIFMHFYRFNFWISYCYLTGLNIAYALAIIPDHDTLETANNYSKESKDWGEVQVRNSGNFGNKVWFDAYNHAFGGINYQIEHHLFPSMCGVYLNKISPIVKQTCKEFDVPYVSHTGILHAFTDFLENVKQIYKKTYLEKQE